MSKNNTRKIKCSGECIDDNKTTIHPLIFNKISFKKDKYEKSTNKNCPSNFFLKSNGLISKCNNNDKLDNSTLVQYMLTPNITIQLEQLLSIYDIDNIDDLKNWIDNNLDSLTFDNINRVFNIWIKANISDLKFFNLALIDISKKILDKFEVDLKYNDSNLKDFIIYWIKKSNEDDFDFNLIIDFKKYLYNKYGSK